MKTLACLALLLSASLPCLAQQVADRDFAPAVSPPAFAQGKGPVVCLDEAHHNFHTLDARFFAWPPADDPGRPPYRGMRPLEAEDAGIFFGREELPGPALDPGNPTAVRSLLQGVAGLAPGLQSALQGRGAVESQSRLARV